MRIPLFQWLVGISLFLSACNEPQNTPKPRAYPRVIYPEHSYEPFDTSFCSFTFEKAKYMRVVQEDKFFENSSPNPCWFNLEMPALGGSIFFTYTPIKTKVDVFKAYNDAYKMAEEHNIKATANSDYLFENENGVKGVIFEVEGNVASPFQFLLTDSLNHALRGALYFRTEARADSLKPIVEFVKVDIAHILNTFKWK